jgi:hypothetical protein
VRHASRAGPKGHRLLAVALPCNAASSQLGYPVDPRVERWARFLAAQDDADYEQLALEDPIMATAKNALDQLSQDPAAHRLARERAHAIKLYEMDRAAAREEGRAEGEARLLLKLLDLRFGPLSEATFARVRSATVEQLEAWSERVLGAPTLDDVLAP